MKFTPTRIPEVVLVEPAVFGDDRGFFMEAWRAEAFAAAGIAATFVQDNHSRSRRGALRGLHYQVRQPQGKLVRVVIGSVYDVAVDLRRGSATFGQWVGCFLSAENRLQMWVPAGFAHGFLVLSESADFVYKCTDYYDPASERVVAWDDPELAIDWPLGPDMQVLLSTKDLGGGALPRRRALSVKVVVTGSTGQLGRALLEAVPADIEAIGLDRAQCDLANPEQCRAVVLESRPDVLINAAAYTQVDKADVERETAFRVNAEGPGALAAALAETGGRLLQVSTDFVFDGQQSVPYAPESPCHPLNVYGASKLAGEQLVQQRLPRRAVILRTAWVYASWGSNFVRTMLRLMATRDAVSVVADQVGSPTWARSLSRAVWATVMRPDISGILHWTDSGVASWYDFAVAIQEEGLLRGLLTRAVPVIPITTADYAKQFPATVARPSFSVLDHRATLGVLELQPVHWRVHLRAMLDELTP